MNVELGRTEASNDSHLSTRHIFPIFMFPVIVSCMEADQKRFGEWKQSPRVCITYRTGTSSEAHKRKGLAAVASIYTDADHEMSPRVLFAT